MIPRFETPTDTMHSCRVALYPHNEASLVENTQIRGKRKGGNTRNIQRIQNIHRETPCQNVQLAG